MKGRGAASGHLRLSGGEARGRKLACPKGIRPAESLVRLAVFNMLGSQIQGALVVDLFAGSGAYGLEALSRGAGEAVFVDRSAAAAAAIRENLARLGWGDRATVAEADCRRWLASPARLEGVDLVFLDPPYNDPALAATLRLLDSLLATGAVVVAEHPAGLELPILDRLRPWRERTYGGTAVTLLEVT